MHLVKFEQENPGYFPVGSEPDTFEATIYVTMIVAETAGTTESTAVHKFDLQYQFVANTSYPNGWLVSDTESALRKTYPSEGDPFDYNPEAILLEFFHLTPNFATLDTQFLNRIAARIRKLRHDADIYSNVEADFREFKKTGLRAEALATTDGVER